MQFCDRQLRVSNVRPSTPSDGFKFTAKALRSVNLVNLSGISE